MFDPVTLTPSEFQAALAVAASFGALAVAVAFLVVRFIRKP